MKAMVLERTGAHLVQKELSVPSPSSNEILVKVTACGVCRTDLHVVDGELEEPKLPLVPGHEIVGVVEETGDSVSGFSKGQRVCIPWLGGTCRSCYYCHNDQENLCDKPVFTGYTRNGGYAEFTLADENYCFHAPDYYSDVELAPLLCAGLIGWRCYKFADRGKNLGIYGFGAAAHIIAQVAIHRNKNIYAFTRPQDKAAQEFAIKLGAIWAGGSDELPPKELDSAIIFAPVGSLVPASLKAIRKGGTIVCGGIYMTDIPSFPYSSLWMEREIKSVANLTRRDAIEFLEIAPKIPVKTETHIYSLSNAQKALDDLKQGNFTGAAVLVPDNLNSK